MFDILNSKVFNKKNFKAFNNSKPFNHLIIDNFFKPKIAKKLEKEFPNYNNLLWNTYKNPIENKKVCNNWNVFPALTYKTFSLLNSNQFCLILEKLLNFNKKLFSDHGLNGGGWHMHKKGGKLNVHLDYSIHPKLKLQRKLNIIIYLNSNWKKKWGGELGFWGNESSLKPGEISKTITPKFNRAVIFDTTQNSWHGLPDKIKCPKNEFRKSLAIYYLCRPPKMVSSRGKALFSPTKDQIRNKKILNLIKKRSNISQASKTYVSN